jgi:hypothetical protein
MHMLTATVVALASGLVLSTASFAQMVVPLEGKLSMNSGAGFREVAGPVSGKVGGFVMAPARSSGQIVYSDGCQVAVVPGRVVTIGTTSPCQNPLGQAPARLAAQQPVEPLTPTPPPPPPLAPRPAPPPISP